ncbi:hypothetical protein PSAR109036_00990 [Psychrobacter arenosus]|uniref:hypothetical protein n=1 Tax=Psychrobacter arenosus TaxID=256326 RepID=UPI00191AAFDE|nr:hypothetical protein [Psychrobacter arenosus]
MGLLDKAKQRANNYISPRDFLRFLAYKLEEPIKDVISFLLYNHFDELVSEYYIDEHYRIYHYADIDCEHKTSKLFKEILKDGYLDYINFCYDFYDDFDDDILSIDEELLDFYEPMKIDFFYSLEELQKMTFITELNLALEESSTLDYKVDDSDMVTLREKPKDGYRFFSIRNTNVKSDAERAKEEQEIIDRHGENSQAHNFYKLIEASLKKQLPHQQKKFKSDKQIISELNEQITEIESELEQVRTQLELEQQQAPQRARAQTDETNTDRKLIAMLAILLAKQSNTFRIGDRPNAKQINEQVYNLTMQIVEKLGMDQADILGLKANTDKISKAVQAYADMFKLSKD